MNRRITVSAALSMLLASAVSAGTTYTFGPIVDGFVLRYDDGPPVYATSQRFVGDLECIKCELVTDNIFIKPGTTYYVEYKVKGGKLKRIVGDDITFYDSEKRKVGAVYKYYMVSFSGLGGSYPYIVPASTTLKEYDHRNKSY